MVYIKSTLRNNEEYVQTYDQMYDKFDKDKEVFDNYKEAFNNDKNYFKKTIWWLKFVATRLLNRIKTEAFSTDCDKVAAFFLPKSSEIKEFEKRSCIT